MKKSNLKSSCCVLLCMDDKCKKKAKKLKQELADALAKSDLEDDVALHATSCMHRCDDGPNVAVYPAGTAYSKVSKKGIKAIVKEVAETVAKS